MRASLTCHKAAKTVFRSSCHRTLWYLFAFSSHSINHISLSLHVSLSAWFSLSLHVSLPSVSLPPHPSLQYIITEPRGSPDWGASAQTLGFAALSTQDHLTTETGWHWQCQFHRAGPALAPPPPPLPPPALAAPAVAPVVATATRPLEKAQMSWQSLC